MDLAQRLSSKNKEDVQLARDRQIFKMNTQQVDKKYHRNPALQKYARKKEQPKPVLQKKKSNIDKYCRTGSAPKDQFKRYMMDTQNVFYDERSSLLMLRKLNSLKIFTMIAFAFLLVTYLFIMKIKPYSGVCPNNASCGVFIHCNPGYDLATDGKSCVVSSRIIDEAQRLCQEVISKASTQYGDRECSNQQQSTLSPRLRVQDIFNELSGDSVHLVKQKIISFLRKEENQKRLGFDYYAGAISISEKSYSFGCRMQLFTKSREFIFGVLGSIVLISLFGYLKLTLSNNKRAKIIYSELRQKVLEDRMVNVSHMKSELQKKYGDIDESLWALVDNLRTVDRDIGFLQEDFLYWKLI